MVHSNLDDEREELFNLAFFIFESTSRLENYLNKEKITGNNFIFFVQEIVNKSLHLYNTSPYATKKPSLDDFLKLVNSNIEIAFTLGFEEQVSDVYLEWKKIVNRENFKAYRFLDSIQKIYKKVIDLSLDFYSYNNLNTNVVNDFFIDVEVFPSQSFYLSSMKKDNRDNAKINIYLSSSKLDFYDYLNIPFFVFHELTSHIFSTNLFCDLLKNRKNQIYGIFEDGWMLYCEYDYYWNYVNNLRNNSWLNTQALDFYINRIFNLSNVIFNGFQIAKWFHSTVLNSDHEKLWSFTSDLATTPYDFFGSNDFHSELINKIELFNRQELHIQLRNIMDNYQTPTEFRKQVFSL